MISLNTVERSSMNQATIVGFHQSNEPTVTSSNQRLDDLKDTLINESEKDNECTSCCKTSLNKSTSHSEGEGLNQILQSWCTCGNMWNTLILSRKRSKRTKPPAVVATGSLNMRNQEYDSEHRSTFTHYEDISQYMEEYRIRRCLSARQVNGNWYSICGISSADARKSEQQSSYAHAPVHVYRQSVEYNRNSDASQAQDKNQSNTTSHHSAASQAPATTASALLRTLPFITNGSQKVSQDDKMLFDRVGKTILPKAQAKKGFLAGRAYEEKEDTKDSEGPILPPCSHEATKTTASETKSTQIKKEKDKLGEKSFVSGTSSPLKESHIGLEKPNIAYIYSSEGGPEMPDEVMKDRLPRLDAWGPQSKMVHASRHHPNKPSEPDHKKDYIRNSASSLPNIGNKLSKSPVETSIPQVIGGSKHIYHRIKRAMSNMEIKPRRNNSKAKQVRVVSDPKGIITKVEVKGPSQVTTISEDVNAISRKRLRKLGTSRSGTWESCQFRS